MNDTTEASVRRVRLPVGWRKWGIGVLLLGIAALVSMFLQPGLSKQEQGMVGVWYQCHTVFTYDCEAYLLRPDRDAFVIHLNGSLGNLSGGRRYRWHMRDDVLRLIPEIDSSSQMPLWKQCAAYFSTRDKRRKEWRLTPRPAGGFDGVSVTDPTYPLEGTFSRMQDPQRVQELERLADQLSSMFLE